MIDRKQATKTVNDWLSTHTADGGAEGPLELCLLEDHTMEANFGWIFAYTSKLFKETGEARYTIAGNAPLIVDRADGSLHITGTAQPIEYYIEDYRRKWKGPPCHFPCPCCGYLTFDIEPNGTFEICPVCFWEDDPVQFENHDYAGGANQVSLREAQRNFKTFGASEQQFVRNVREPRPDEMPASI